MAEDYSLTPVQADAILRMTLGQLVNLEQEKLGRGARDAARRDRRVPAASSRDEARIYAIIREDLRDAEQEARRRPPHRDQRRGGRRRRPRGPDRQKRRWSSRSATRATSSGRRRAPTAPSAAAARASRAPRPTRTIRSSTCSSPARTTTCCSSRTRARSTGRRCTTCRQLSRESKGRAVVNLLNLAEGEKIADCRAVRDFDQPDHYLMMATRKGLVKKTTLEAYSRPMKTRHHRHQAQGGRRAGRRGRSPSRATR